MSVFIGYPSFMAYQMMKGKKGNNDGFPSIPGMIARYSASGLTNEQMAANPVWVDKTGNGHDLQMKNFAWSGMSGVGGYNQNFNQWGYGNLPPALQTYTPHKMELNIPSTLRTGNVYSNLGKEGDIYDFTLNIVGLKDGASLDITKGVVSGNIERIKKDGIYKIYQPLETSWDQLRIYIVIHNPNLIDLNITIEQLPLYPGFILGDGVDDVAVTEKELNFEDTYTVYTAFIPFQNNPTRNMILCGADSKKTFSMQYSSLVYVAFIAGNNYYINADFVNGLNLFACKRNGNNICIKNLLTNKVVTGTCGDWVENAGLYYLWKNATYASFAKAAIAGQTICNGYFSTDEDDEKVLDWYKKQYPWLFPDQAWTVTGKTNEDKGRATIANITGNGNDLVLSNFGFAENSGYGLYYQYFGNGFQTTNGEIIGGSWNKINNYNYNISCNIRMPINAIGKCFWHSRVLTTGIKLRFKLTGMAEGDVLAFGYTNVYDLTYTSDGIYIIELPPTDRSCGFSLQSSLTENLPTTPVTIELLPFDYEGYLVTDGVDDEITSSTFEMGNDWTVIGDWELINTGKNDNAGIVKFDSIVIYNYNPILINIKNGRNNLIPDQNTVNAICSDGRIYSKDWKESIYNEETESTSKNLLTIGYSGNSYTKIAFKNLAIYPTVLSKEDCIKAYNYLQTLKAK